jgi:hypothetical protein
MKPLTIKAIEQAAPIFKTRPASIIVAPGMDLGDMDLDVDTDLSMIEVLYRISQDTPTFVQPDGDALNAITDFFIHLPIKPYVLWDPAQATGGALLRAANQFERIPLSALKDALLAVAETSDIATLSLGKSKNRQNDRLEEKDEENFFGSAAGTNSEAIGNMGKEDSEDDTP